MVLSPFVITTVGKPNEIYHRYHLFYIYILQPWFGIQVIYMFGHHDPSSGEPLGNFQFFCRNKLNKAIVDYAYNRPQKPGELSMSSKTSVLDGISR